MRTSLSPGGSISSVPTKHRTTPSDERQDKGPFINQHSGSTVTPRPSRQQGLFIIALISLGTLAASCSSDRVIIREPDKYSRYEPQERPPAKSYQRGDTDYTAGRASVTQPDIFQTPDRSFDGFRVAGPDSDLAPGWWDTFLQKAQSEGRGSLFVFDTFRARHKDLEVYKTEAAAAVLREFRRWADQRGLGEAFSEYWGQ